MYFAREVYVIDDALTITGFLRSSWYQVRTVLTEELLCRGVILYIMIKNGGIALPSLFPRCYLLCCIG